MLVQQRTNVKHLFIVEASKNSIKCQVKHDRFIISVIKLCTDECYRGKISFPLSVHDGYWIFRQNSTI